MNQMHIQGSALPTALPPALAPQLQEELSDEQRLEKARVMAGQVDNNASFLAFLSLYREDRDVANPDWINQLAIVADNPKHDYYDGDVAHALYLKAAKMGSPEAAYNLGVRWLRGYDGKIDAARARDWFKRAYELGHGCGGSTYAGMLMSDPRYGAPDHEDFTEMTHEVLVKSEELGGAWALYHAAGLLASGRLGEREYPGALARYDLLATEEICDAPKARGAQCLALYHFLGLILDYDPHKAIEFLDQIPRTASEVQVRYRVMSVADKLRHIMTTELIPYDAEHRPPGGNAFVMPPEHQAAYDFMRDFWSGKTGLDDALRGIEAGTINATQALSDRLWAASVLAWEEQDGLLSECLQLRFAVEQKRLGVTREQVTRSTNDFGAQYNRVDERHIPIPGAATARSQVLLPKSFRGYGRFLGVQASADGNIAFSFETPAAGATLAVGAAPLLLNEDLDVVLALAFGDPERVLWPSLSVEPVEKETPDRPRSLFQQKLWDPEWVAHTELGKTYYATDYWIGKLAWESGVFSTADIADKSTKLRAEFLLNAFALCGGREDGMRSRVMLRPVQVNRSWRAVAGGSLTCEMHHVAMRVDGADTITHADGREEKELNLNDRRYASGRIGQLLTDHYDDLAALWPMFERLRQLHGLMYAMAELRGKGFEPGLKIRARIDRTLRRFGRAPALPLTARLVS